MRLADFYLNPFTYVGYKNKYFFPYQSLYFGGYSTMLMSYFELDPVGLIWLLTFLTLSFFLCSKVSSFDFVDPPRITHISGNQTFKKGDIVSLNCTASGNPAPNISWSRVSDGSVVTFPLNVTSHHNGAYRCTADNGYGDPSTAVVSVSIQSRTIMLHFTVTCIC